MMDELLTINQVSKKLKTNVATVYKLIQCKRLIALKLGAYKVRASTLDRFMADEEARQNPEIKKDQGNGPGITKVSI
jgi:excisionase family DNA binding protein